MRLLYLLLVAVSCILYSCYDHSATGYWKITEDSISINPSLLNNKYNVKSSPSKGTLFQGYNKVENEIVLIDLDSAKTILSLKPSINYKEAGRLVQFDIYKADSIFIITEDYVFIVNATGKTIYKKELITALENKNGEEILLWDNDNQFPLHYNSSTKELLIKIVCNCSFMESKYFNYNLEGWFNLETGSIKKLNYSFPGNYYKNSYAQSVFSYRVLNDSLNIISFQSQDSLYVYNNKRELLSRYYGKSKYQAIEFIPFDTINNEDLERVKEYLTVNPIYQKILYDPYKQIYYRFFLKEKELKNEKGIYNDIFSKDVIIMVFNRDFEIIEERNIGNSYAWYFSFVTPKGLHIKKYNSEEVKNNSYEKFTIFNWH